MDSQTPPPSAQGARCTLHAGQPFVAICPGCGTYMCQQCTENGTFQTCATCRARAASQAASAVGRERFAFREVWRASLSVYSKNWVTLTLGLVLSGLGLSVVQSIWTSLYIGLFGFDVDSIFSPSSLVFSSLLALGHACLQLVFVAGFLRLSLRAVRGQSVTLGALFSEWYTLPKLALQLLLLNASFVPLMALIAAPVFLLGFSSGAVNSDALMLLLVVFVPLMLALVTYLSLGVCFAPIELIAHPGLGVLESIQNAWAIARTRRLAILACGSACSGLMFAGFIACFVGLVVAIPLASVLFIASYLALRNDAQGLKP